MCPRNRIRPTGHRLPVSERRGRVRTGPCSPFHLKRPTPNPLAGGRSTSEGVCALHDQAPPQDCHPVRHRQRVGRLARRVEHVRCGGLGCRACRSRMKARRLAGSRNRGFVGRLSTSRRSGRSGSLGPAPFQPLLRIAVLGVNEEDDVVRFVGPNGKWFAVRIIHRHVQARIPPAPDAPTSLSHSGGNASSPKQERQPQNSTGFLPVSSASEPSSAPPSRLSACLRSGTTSSCRSRRRRPRRRSLPSERRGRGYSGQQRTR